MTKAACKLILRIGSVSLSWRTFKSLKRLGKDCNGNDIEWEILQLWSLYTFQILFSRMEWIALFIPFYYYFKMILLIATFLPGTRFPNYWFEIILVPLMHHAHSVLNYDWKGFKKEVILLPYQLIDLFLLPGFFTTEEEINAIIYLRKKQLDEASQSVLKTDPDTSRDSSCTIIEKNVSVSRPISPERKGIDLEPDSGASWSRVAASGQQLRKLSLEYRRHSLPNTVNSPTRREMRPTPENDPRFNTATNTPPTSFNLKRGAIGLRSYDSPTPSSKAHEILEDANTYISSRRVTMRSTRRANPINETVSTPIRKRNTVRVYSPRTPHDAVERLNKLVQESYDDDVSIKSGRSSSLGDGLRRFITGNPNIRLRDYLFDLDLPSVPLRENISPKRSRISVRDNLDDRELQENRRNEWNIQNEIRPTGVYTVDSNQKYKPRRSSRLAAIKTSK